MCYSSRVYPPSHLTLLYSNEVMFAGNRAHKGDGPELQPTINITEHRHPDMEVSFTDRCYSQVDKWEWKEIL